MHYHNLSKRKEKGNKTVPGRLAAVELMSNPVGYPYAEGENVQPKMKMNSDFM